MGMMRTFMILLAASQSSHAIPSYQGCVSNSAKGFPYCDPSLPLGKRLDDLMGRLSLADMVGLISSGDSQVSCNMPSLPIDRSDLVLPGYTWLVETNTGVHATCLGKGMCPTVFPGPVAMGASFNRTLWRAKGSVIGTEMRALNNAGGRIDYQTGLKVGLSGFGPNINVIRDPRFGRVSARFADCTLLTAHCWQHSAGASRAVHARHSHSLLQLPLAGARGPWRRPIPHW